MLVRLIWKHIKNYLVRAHKWWRLRHASNVLGTINPVKEMTAIAHAHNVPVLIDGAQAVPHMPVDVQDIDCDFYVFSAHKLYGPTGIGILYGKKALLDAMPPYQGGGDMIETVAFDKVTYAKAPQKFEAGTPDIAGVIGLGAAINYVQTIGMDNVFAHEQALLDYAEAKLKTIPGLRIIGTSKPKVGVISFVLDGIHPHDIGTVLDHEGIAVRAGHHCAMPLMQRFNVPATVRVSFGIYNNEKDIDAVIEAHSIGKEVIYLMSLRELYQEIIIDHGRQPRNFGKLDQANHCQAGHNPLCGDKLMLYVTERDGVIEEVRFEGQVVRFLSHLLR